jgi:hypothetical protein
LTKNILQKSEINCNLQVALCFVYSFKYTYSLKESFLRLQATTATDDLQIEHTKRAEYVKLSECAIALRRVCYYQVFNTNCNIAIKVLSRVPDEMRDRRTFLETIKLIAASIKSLLDATNVVLAVSDER